MKKLFLLSVLLLSSVLWGQNQASGNITATSASCGTNNVSNTTACVVLHLNNNSGTVFIDLTGTFSATVQFEVSATDGATWRAKTCYPTNSTTGVSSATAAGGWTCPAMGASTYIRVRSSAYTSGTVIVQINQSSASASLGTGGGGGGGGITNSAPAGAVPVTADGSGNLATSGETSDGSGNMTGASYIAPIFKSSSSNPASTGIVRLANTNAINWRNAANSADIGISFDGSNLFQIGGSGTTVAGNFTLGGGDLTFTNSTHTLAGGSSLVFDMTGANVTRLRIGAGATTGSNGSIAYDTTNTMWHAYTGVDSIIGVIPASVTPANNDCVKWTLSSGKYTLNTAGAACGSGAISGLTTGYIPKAASSTTIANSGLDDGITTANVLTYVGSAGVAATQYTTTGTTSGALDLVGAATDSSITTGAAGWVGPTSAVTTPFRLRMPTAESASASVMTFGAASSHYMQGSFTTLASGMATFWTTPSSANLRSALTDETGTGNTMFSTAPKFDTYWDVTESAAPGAPAAGISRVYGDSTSHKLAVYLNGGSVTNILTSAGAASIASGKTLTVSNSITLAGTDSTTMTFPSSSATITQTIASGAKALGTSAISANTCTSAQTDTATGGATTDSVSVAYASDPSGVTGYGAGTSGGITIRYYVTANTMNFKQCNETGSSITPGAMTINWRIVR